MPIEGAILFLINTQVAPYFSGLESDFIYEMLRYANVFMPAEYVCDLLSAYAALLIVIFIFGIAGGVIKKWTGLGSQ